MTVVVVVINSNKRFIFASELVCFLLNQQLPIYHYYLKPLKLITVMIQSQIKMHFLPENC